ncbi:MAG: addiction module antidote protein, HigA family [Betaproteobacteria bacterium]|nr:addiction module antidote protein, HigA family [Betaproteobacteria bacterium]
MEMYNPPHPGQILKEFFPDGLSVTEAARRLQVSRQTLSAVINGRAGITADMALRLACALGNKVDFWLRLQMQYDLWHAKKHLPKGIQKLAA